MENTKTDEAARLRNGIDKAIEQIKQYAYQDKYAQFIEGNHYGFIAVVDAIEIIEKGLRGEYEE